MILSPTVSDVEANAQSMAALVMAIDTKLLPIELITVLVPGS